MTFFASKKRIGQQRGMTLLEILLYVSISAAVIFLSSAVLSTVYEIKQKGKTIQTVEEEGNLLAYTIDRYIQSASIVFSPNKLSESDQLFIKIIVNNKESDVVLSLVDGVLYNQTDGGKKIALSSSDVVVSDLKFTYLGPTEKGFLRYSFTVSGVDKSGRNEYKKTFSSGASLR